MSYDRVAMSSGHGKHVAGAVGILNEHQEAVRVVNAVAGALRLRGVEVETYEDTVSKSQGENLDRLVDWHNSRTRDVDISVHFNAFDGKAHGTEVLYLTQAELADVMSEAIAAAGGFTNRGPKLRSDLAFLNGTEQPAILIEVCFVDSITDAELYQINFVDICDAIAEVLGGEDEGEEEELPPLLTDHLFEAVGKCSHFGGPDDMGVAPDEGLAFHFEINEANQHLFLPLVPAGTSGLARRLNAKGVHYCAARWDYSVTPKEMLAGDDVALVTNAETGMSQTAFPADWGPNDQTGRVADLSPALMRDLGLETDDTVEVVYPWRG